MAVLLLAEITDGDLSLDATAKAVSASKALGDVTVLAVGAKAKDAAAVAAKIAGVSKVLVAEDALYGHRLAEPVAALIVSLAGDYSHIVAPATTDAKNILPRVAALLDVMGRCQLNSLAPRKWPVLERQMLAAPFQASKASIR